MNINELASLVAVRNHIYIVINDKSVTKKEDYRPLDEKRRDLDLKFVQVLLDLDDVQDLFIDPKDLGQIKLEGADLQNPTPKKQLDFFEGGSSKKTKVKTTKKKPVENSIKKGVEEKVAEVEKLESEEIQLESSVVPQDTQLLLEEKKKLMAAEKAASDPEIASAIARQKKALDKEGRFNKKVEKANGTTG